MNDPDPIDVHDLLAMFFEKKKEYEVRVKQWFDEHHLQCQSVSYLKNNHPRCVFCNHPVGTIFSEKTIRISGWKVRELRARCGGGSEQDDNTDLHVYLPVSDYTLLSFQKDHQQKKEKWEHKIVQADHHMFIDWPSKTKNVQAALRKLEQDVQKSSSAHENAIVEYMEQTDYNNRNKSMDTIIQEIQNPNQSHRDHYMNEWWKQKYDYEKSTYTNENIQDPNHAGAYLGTTTLSKSILYYSPDKNTFCPPVSKYGHVVCNIVHQSSTLVSSSGNNNNNNG